MTYLEWSVLLKNERLPVAIVDLDAFDRNLNKMIQVLGDSKKTVRIATKSLRVPKLIERVVKSGGPFKGLMCYSAEEVRMLAGMRFDDFLLAYPTLQASDLESLRQSHEMTKKVTVVVDCIEHLQALSAIFKDTPRPIGVAIEVDCSFRAFGFHIGVRRSPVRTIQDVFFLYNEMRNFPGLQFRGLMAYEAQIAGLTDRNPFRRALNPIFSWIRKLSVERVAQLRREISDAFKNQAIALEMFNGGGTGSLNFAAAEPALTELSAGSALFDPHLFDYYSNIKFEPACFFALQAVRSSDRGYLTCQGGGYVASGEPGWEKVPKPYLPEGLELVSAEACGEVQTPVRLRSIKPSKMKLGDPVLFRHSKAGELMERFNEVILVSGGEIVGREKTYRGLGVSFF